MKTLEIGKSYISRDGQSWLVTDIFGNRFSATTKSNNGRSTRETNFTSNGHYYTDDIDSMDDLIIPQDVIPHIDVILAIVQGKTAQWFCCDRWIVALDPATFNPVTKPDQKWRIKPEKKTIKIGDVTIIAPETEPLETGTPYFVLYASQAFGPKWTNHALDSERLANGEIFLTREDATNAKNAIRKLFINKSGV